jgi:hypothetical protein
VDKTDIESGGPGFTILAIWLIFVIILSPLSVPPPGSPMKPLGLLFRPQQIFFFKDGLNWQVKRRGQEPFLDGEQKRNFLVRGSMYGT